jgi:MFS transporter, SP family, xylose:H+ symportor
MKCTFSRSSKHRIARARQIFCDDADLLRSGRPGIKMQTGINNANRSQSSTVALHSAYVWWIALVAAMGGLLFGYDWVVIGGAKPFYEVYFHLNSANLIGWANSCALVGCLAGALIAGEAGDRFGRKKVLLLSALVFAVSSILTGWAPVFTAFIAWRITGGVAIGLASNISPLYIAEISPAQWRGRLVSLNQLAIVCGILAAQIANWLIAEKVPAGGLVLAQSWNAQYGWRWMFTAVAAPAILFFLLALAIPESPRWLAGRTREREARQVLARIGGEDYATGELAAIEETLRAAMASRPGWADLFKGPVRKLAWMGIALAVLQQWSGINILFNYAEEIYKSAGYGVSGIMFNIVITGAINLIFTVVAMTFVDRLGRRKLMLLGCAGVGLCHLGASLAYHAGWRGSAVLILTLAAIACYSMSLAPITWVLISEIFPNRLRGLGVSAAVGALWTASFALTYTFPFLNRAFSTSGTFLAYAAVCFLGFVFVFKFVPETRGKTLEEIEGQAMQAASPVRR